MNIAKNMSANGSLGSMAEPYRPMSRGVTTDRFATRDGPT